MNLLSAPRQLIAVVDDDPAVRKAIALLLTATNFDVQTFSSGVDLLHSLRTRLPDFLVLDLNMPHLDGLAVQERIAQAGIRLPFLIVTADDSGVARQRALGAGACAYLDKPVAQQTLLDAIHAALGKPPQ